MNIRRTQLFAGMLVALFAFPGFSHAQLKYEDAMAQSTSAHAAIVINQITGEVLYGNRASEVWVPASLTKLTTALVVLDTQPDFAKLCNINAGHDVGGAKLYIAGPAKYSLRDLLSASLVGSANNATNAIAECTGMTTETFVKTMNAKAKQLGAKNTNFVDPSGISEHSHTTAEDMAQIANAAFSTKTIRDFSQQSKVSFCSKSGAKKCHTIKNTNQLLTDSSIRVLAGKTGYLDESKYNFAASFRNSKGQYVIAVVLGSPTKNGSFADAKKLAQIGWAKIALAQSKQALLNRYQPGQKVVGLRLPLAIK